MNSLSPLNFSRLINEGSVDRDVRYETVTHKREALPVEAWACPMCRSLHEDKEDAEECCAEDELVRLASAHCPCCGLLFDGPNQFRDAADCCLWKDLDAFTRWRMADAVEEGSTWAEQLNLPPSH